MYIIIIILQSHLHRVYQCFTVTCRLQIWQNDLDATAVIQGRNGYRNNSQHRKLALKEEKKKKEEAPAVLVGTRTLDLSFTSPAL